MGSIRKASVADATALAEIAEATFRATFGAANTAANLELHCRRNFGPTLQSAEITDPGMVTLLADAGGQLVGFAQARWADAPGCVAAAHPGEIHRLYVREGWHGKGVAHRMMDACVAELGRRGCDAVWLGVWEHNPRAIAFYTKCGFVAVGVHVFQLGEDPQRDVVMAKPLASLPAPGPGCTSPA